MKVLYIYRNPSMGFSIGKVFAPIESAMTKYCEVDSIYMPATGYGLRALWRNTRYVLKYIHSKKYDVIHITGTENYLLPFLRNYKTVVTVHDLNSFSNNTSGIRLKIKQIVFVKTIKLANIITFISDRSKTETQQVINMNVNQDVVIHNPIDPQYRYTYKDFNYQQPTILHIGTKDNKNLSRVIESLIDIPCKLNIIGLLSQEIKDKLSFNNIKYINSSNISDNEMLKAYEECDIVSFPSTYEGFGMPIIEGQAIGRVVVTSSISPMKDVANNSAILVDPFCVESISNGFKKAVEHQEKYIRLGLINVSRFELNYIVKQYYSQYEKL